MKPPIQGVDLPVGEGARCAECTHPLTWHDADGCRYGHGNVNGGCQCKRPHGKKRRSAFASPGTEANGYQGEPRPPYSPFRELQHAAGELARAFERFAHAAGDCAAAEEREPTPPLLMPVGHTRVFPTPKTTKDVQDVLAHQGPRVVVAPKASSTSPATHETSLDVAKLPGQSFALLELIATEAGEDVDDVPYAHLSITGYKKRTISTYVGALRGVGFLDGDRNGLAPTARGIAALRALGRYNPAPKSGAELRDYLRSSVSKGPLEILELACRVYPAELTYDAIREHTRFADRSITTYVGELVRRHTVHRSKRGITAHERLFLDPKAKR